MEEKIVPEAPVLTGELGDLGPLVVRPVRDEEEDGLVEALRQSLPSFAEQLAMDGKAIPSFAPHANKNTTIQRSIAHISNRDSSEKLIASLVLARTVKMTF